MEIRAKSTYDYDTVRALTHLTMFKKADPKKRMIFWTVTYAVLLAIIVWEIALFGLDRQLLIMLLVWVAISLLAGFFYFLLPKLHYKALAKMQKTENTFVFDDEGIAVSSIGAAYSGEARLQYALISKAYETSKYFFIFQTMNQVFIVDKSTILNGTAKEIRDKLTSFLGKKYRICNY